MTRLTAKDMRGVKVHAGWDDGREGFCYCRVDAVLTAAPHHFRAELTWELEDELAAPGEEGFVYPELWLEANELRSGDHLVTLDGVKFRVDVEDAIALMEGDPVDLLTKYGDIFASLKERTCLA